MKYSLVIGRFQPPHVGHFALIYRLLSEGKNVCVAVRDTPFDENNPYSVPQRFDLLAKEFGDKIKIIRIPDIEEVVYGRKVGWSIREIRLDEETEKISATEIRRKNDNLDKRSK